jgi:hypothetical protein
MIKRELMLAVALIGGSTLLQTSFAQAVPYPDRINGGEDIKIDRPPERLDTIGNATGARGAVESRRGRQIGAKAPRPE